MTGKESFGGVFSAFVNWTSTVIHYKKLSPVLWHKAIGWKRGRVWSVCPLKEEFVFNRWGEEVNFITFPSPNFDLPFLKDNGTWMLLRLELFFWFTSFCLFPLSFSFFQCFQEVLSIYWTFLVWFSPLGTH